MDKIFIKDLELMMSIGIYEHERAKKQRVIVNIKAFVEPPAMGWQNEDIKESVSYEELVNEITELPKSQHFELVETFAEKIAQSCLGKTNVKSVNIHIEKPDIIEGVESVGVEITRKCKE